MRDATMSRRFRWCLGLGSLGIVLLLASRAYYTLIFLPQHHGSGEAARRLIDLDGWTAFMRSGPGMLLNGAAGACLIAAVGLLVASMRRDVPERRPERKR